MWRLTVEPTPEHCSPDLAAVVDGVTSGATTAGELPGALQRAVALAPGSGGDEVVFEAEPAPEALDLLVRSAGFAPVRTTLQMRAPLPVPPDRRGAPARRALALRGFRPGVDDEAWLETNNRAFAWHPDQSGWTRHDLDLRMAEPWFRSDGFLVLDDPEEPGRLAGFCWTKVHLDHEPPLGEIYVIGVDPSHHGEGLGRALALAGLDRLAEQGLEVGMLYVEADNEPAVGLYRALGFVEHHAHRWWRARAG